MIRACPRESIRVRARRGPRRKISEVADPLWPPATTPLRNATCRCSWPAGATAQAARARREVYFARRARAWSKTALEHVARDHDALDLARALVDARDAGVAVQLLDHVFGGVAHAAVDLHRAVDDPVEGLAREQLDHRRLAREGLARIAHVRGSIDHAFEGENVGRRVGEHELDQLVGRQRLAEGLALLGVADRERVRLARAAEAIGGERESPAVERAERDLEAAADVAEAVVVAQTHVVEGECHRARTAL